MLHNEPLSISDCILETSSIRLSSYRNFFRVDDHDAYSIYKWNEELSSRLMKLIGVIEVILRNRIHSTMSNALQGKASGNKDSNDWFNYLDLGVGKSKVDNVLYDKKKRKITPTPSANFVISKMTYGFWPNLLKTEKYLDRSNIQWDILFASVFPGLPKKPKGYWDKIKKENPI